jgi:RNA polymerase sigma-70 factor, ECF subfamily
MNVLDPRGDSVAEVMTHPELKLLKLSDAEETDPAGAVDASPSHAFVMSLQEGDVEALRVLYREHHQTLRMLGRHLLGDANDAEDLLHEVFLAVPRALRRYRGECSLRTFLTSIAIKRAGKVLRRLGRYRRALTVLETHHRSAGPEPERAAELRELSVSIANELRRLPFAQRAVVVLCLVEERSAAEAAAILQIPESTVRTRLFYGRRRLRDRLQRHR